MSNWSDQTEDELTIVLKEWLKAQGRTQADLRRSLNADSTRMPALLNALRQEYLKGGLPKVADRLCTIEKAWIDKNQSKEQVEPISHTDSIDPFDQLDLLLEEIREDCVN